MSDTRELSDEGAPSGDGVLSHPSAGMLLRKAREGSGLHIGALAVSLKVPVKKLEALEADRLDQLPDAVFARALAASVCRTLKVDPAPVLAALPSSSGKRLHDVVAASNPPFRLPGRGPQKSVVERLSRPFMLLAGVFLVGAVGLFIYPSLEGLIAEVSAGSQGGAASIKSPSLAVVLPVRTPAGSDIAAQVTSSVPIGATVTDVVGETKIETTTLPVVPPNGASGTVAPPSVLTIVTRGSTWAEVTDASRVVQLRRTMSAGESQSISGVLPLKVTLGRADAVDVQVHGKAFDVASFTKDNVARFEVKE